MRIFDFLKKKAISAGNVSSPTVSETINDEQKKASRSPLSFDVAAEKRLLRDYSNTKSDAMQHHFVLMQLQDFYYKYRSIDPKYLNLCIKYCYEDIELLPEVRKQHVLDEQSIIRTINFKMNQKDLAREFAKIQPFQGNVKSFERLAIIYEKQQEYDQAIGICQQAFIMAMQK